MPTVNDANGTPMRVRDNGFALNYAVTITMESHAAHSGNAYSLVYNIDPNVVGDFLYIKNSSDMPLRIYNIHGFTTGTAGAITIKTGVTGTPTTGISITPVNSLVGSGNTAEGTFNRNTSAASMALTGGNTYDVLQLQSASTGNQYSFNGEISIEKNQTFVLTNAVDPTAVMTFVVYFYYHEDVE